MYAYCLFCDTVKCEELAERIRRECLNCPAMKDCERYPARTVSIDNMCRGDGDALLRKQRVSPCHATQGETATPLPPDVETRLREELERFMTLSFTNKMLLCWIMSGNSLATFSRMDWLPKGVKVSGSISRQAVDERVRTLKRHMPGLEKFIEQLVKMNSGSKGEESRVRQKNKRCLMFRKPGNKPGGRKHRKK